MKAVIHEGPEKYSYTQDFPKPSVDEGDILIKVNACGFCGTDYKIFTFGHRAITPPRVTGHEIVGTVDEVGGSVKKDLKNGDRVIVVTPVGCMKCNYCREGRTNMCSLVAKDVHSIGYYTDGGFAEYCLIPKEAVDQDVLIKIPDSMTDEEAAVVEPLSCVINGQEKLNVTPNDTVFIIGTGPIGCLHALLAKAQGVKKIILTDISDEKLEMAKKVLPEATFFNSSSINPIEKINELTDFEGANVVIVAAPSPQAQQLAIQSASILGRVSFFAGLPKGINGSDIETNLIHYREIEVYGAFASNRGQYIRAVDLISSKKIDLSNLITHTLELSEVDRAIELFKNGKTMKTIIKVS